MIKSILEDILFFVNNVEFSFVHRKSNVSTHLLAQWTALVNWFGPVLISNLPSHVSQAFVRQLEMGPGPIFLCLPYFGLSLLSNKVFIQNIYIYMCVCVCVCVCVFRCKKKRLESFPCLGFKENGKENNNYLLMYL